MISKVTLKTERFFGKRTLTLHQVPEAVKTELDYWTQLEERLGIKHKITFHVWMDLLILEWTIRILLYQVNIFGRFDYNRGILTLFA